MEQSIILSWSKENAENAPNCTGVYLLRSTPVNGDIVDIKTSPDLKTDLLQLFEHGVSEEVKYFNWVATPNIETSESEIIELKRRYHLS